MHLDGVETTITRNLREALDQLASEGKAKNIWVDAVCINQTDAEEKKHQIQLMSDIYSKAEVTYIWLGEATNNSDLAMDFLSNIKDEDFKNYNPEDPAWEALRLLFDFVDRPWWTRMWVLQESILSPSPVVKCGTKEVKLERFVDFNYLFDEYLRLDAVRFASLSWFCEIPYRDMLWRDMKKKWLDGLLGAWLPYVGKFKCTVLRDRVYALLGFIQEASRMGINVDYTTRAGTSEYVKSDDEVLSEATAVLFKELGIFVLQYVGGEKGDELKLPSWCPDWTRHHTFIRLSPLGYSAYIPGKIKNESEIRPWLREGTSVAKSDILRFSTDEKTLGVRGFLVDTIDFSDKTLDGTAKERACLTLEACKRWENHVLSHKANSYDTSCGWLEAFWRTVIADRDWNRDGKASPPLTLKSNFDAWMGRPDPKVQSMADNDRFAFEKEYSYPAIATCRKRSFITTTKGYFGLAHHGARMGDWVCVLRGVNTPFILRPAKNENYSVIGEAYVHGIMNGEILETLDVKDFREFWFE
jgi:hypothetical protein